MTTVAAAPLGKLAPGEYRLEAWGRPTTGGGYSQFFTRDFTVRADTFVVEFYHEVLDHYFMAASADEIELLDSGGQGGLETHGTTLRRLAQGRRRAAECASRLPLLCGRPQFALLYGRRAGVPGIARPGA
jgi:hypothetical protein